MNPLESRRLRKFATVALIAVGAIGLAGCTQSLPHPELSLPFSQGENAQATSTPTTKPLFEANQEFLVQSIGPVNLPIPVPEEYEGDVIPGRLLFTKPEIYGLTDVRWSSKTNPFTASTQESRVAGVVQVNLAKQHSVQAFVFTERHALEAKQLEPSNLQPIPKHPVFLYIPNDSEVKLDSKALETLRKSHFGGSVLMVQAPLDRADLTTGIGYVNLVTNEEGETVLTAPGGPLGTDLRIPIPKDELLALEVYRAQQTPFAKVVQTIQASKSTFTRTPTSIPETPPFNLTPQAEETLIRIQNATQGTNKNTAEPTRTPVTQLTPPAKVVGADGSVWIYDYKNKVYQRAATAPPAQQEKETSSILSPSPTLTPLKTETTKSSNENNPFTSTPALVLYGVIGGLVGLKLTVRRLIDRRKKAKEEAEWIKKVDDWTNKLMVQAGNKEQLERLTQAERGHQNILLVNYAQLREKAEEEEKKGNLMEAIKLKRESDEVLRDIKYLTKTIENKEAGFRSILRKQAEQDIRNFRNQLVKGTI